MKADNASEKWDMIATCLKEASKAGTWVFWRERFNTNHPEHVRRSEIVNAEQYAKTNWFAAKNLYCSNKQEIDEFADFLLQTLEGHPGISQDMEFFFAMKKTIDKEVEEQMENVLTEENDMGRNRQVDPDFFEEELNDDVLDHDEDEEYLREIGSLDDEDLWDGDEFLGDNQGLFNDEEFADDFD